MTDLPGGAFTATGQFTIATLKPPPQYLTIGPHVRISLDTGAIEYGYGYNPDEAARTFWEAMSKTYGTALAAVERIQTLHQRCACRRDLDISLTPIVHCDCCDEEWPCLTIQALEQP